MGVTVADSVHILDDASQATMTITNVAANTGEWLLIGYVQTGAITAPPTATWNGIDVPRFSGASITVDDGINWLFQLKIAVGGTGSVVVTDHSATHPDHRAAVTVHVRNVDADDFHGISEDGFAYPFNYGPDAITPGDGMGSNYVVFIHAEENDVATTPCLWGGQPAIRRGGSAFLVIEVFPTAFDPSTGFLVTVTSPNLVPHAGTENAFRSSPSVLTIYDLGGFPAGIMLEKVAPKLTPEQEQAIWRGDARHYPGALPGGTPR